MLNKEELQTVYNNALKERIESVEKNTEKIIHFIEEQILISAQNLRPYVFFNFADKQNGSFHFHLYPQKFNQINIAKLVKYFESCKFNVLLRDRNGNRYSTEVSGNNNLEDYFEKSTFKDPIYKDIDLKITFLDIA